MSSSTDEKDLSHFVTIYTSRFFDRFYISDLNFISDEPEQWFNNNAYKEGARIIAQINVVNDTAERGVELIKELFVNGIITKDEDQKQYLFEIVTDYKKKFPDC